ncbi:MAG: hypothetical protein MZU91_13635 [Desulfosudis oleivorans]|nr:hypothetical protein [Desulfosudis oleivorans]
MLPSAAVPKMVRSFLVAVRRANARLASCCAKNDFRRGSSDSRAPSSPRGLRTALSGAGLDPSSQA